VKNYNKTKPIRIEEFDAEKAWWGSEADGFAARVENERAWKVSIEQIKAAGYNLDQKNPHAPDAVSHDPEQLLADYARLQGEAQALRDELKANQGHPVFAELQALVRKTTGLADVLRRALQPLGEQVALALVFGSMASGSAHAGSDVDLLVVGSASFAQVVEATYAAQTQLGRDINPKVMTPAEWAARQAEGNPFVQELLAKPQILLIGTLHA
jgi:predicted nucleotidyltransferase